MSRSDIELELSRLYAENKMISPSMVVSAAENNESPLHRLFDWDDQSAGHSFRLLQARGILRKYRIVVESESQPEQLYNVRIRHDREGEYHPLSVVVSHPDWFRSAADVFRRKIAELESPLRELEKHAPDSFRLEKLPRIEIALNELKGVSDSF